MLNYEEDIRIDPDSLDIEWLEQPTLLLRYAKNLANTRKILDEAKETLDITRAKADKDIRNNPDNYKIDKVTEGSVSAAILLHKEFKEANKEFLEAKYNVEMAQAALNAVNQRKDALENLVRLHGMQYFAGPKMPRNISDEWNKRKKDQQDSNEIVKNKMRRAK
jgi:hypothetical protein